ncbi:MAG: DUF1574 domain-containing protein [Cyanobacteria bacterium Co-bin13]|nr:DUF1574 domain-containing protein [Cyanobacteria bacterium Co-bin13]
MPVPLSHTPSNIPSTSGPTVGPAAGIVPWLQQIIGTPAAKLHMKLRGNILHLLCETPEALDQAPVLLNLVRGLLEPQGAALVKQAYPQVYQIYLYSRAAGNPVPAWTAPIYLNRLERHLAQLVLESQDESDLKATQALLKSYTGGDPKTLQAYAEDGAGGAIVLSNLSLARKGDPEAVAWYLSETLSALDVGVWVSIKAIPGTAHLPKVAATIEDHGAEEAAPVELPGQGEATIPRLWILCEAVYSPDPSLIARPTAERLRQLQLTQYKDAVLLMQVRGEATPDWSLRIDLTPPEEMLREWARWGEVDAIATLLTPRLEPLHLTVTAELKESTLHLVCQAGPAGDLPPWTTVQERLLPLLESLAPQGIHRIVVYGQAAEDAAAWVGCADLPGAEHEDLALSPSALAAAGDLPAIAFLLTRLLNPSLEEQLATGGLRVQLLVRDKLLHVMVDGPIAPQRRQVAASVSQRLRQLNISGIQGVRIYGRRSGQAQPSWSYGADFVSRRRLVPESAPEFTASDAYVNELLARPDAPVQELEIDTAAAPLGQWSRGLLQSVRQGLVRSHLFAPQTAPDFLQSAPDPATQDGMRIALVWGTVGLLMALQIDWLMGQLLRPPASPGVAEATPLPEEIEPTSPAAEPTLEDQLADLNWGQGAAASGFGQGGFGAEEGGSFTGTSNQPFGATSANLPTSPQQPIAATDDLLVASPYPSFRSQQLDEKLALYHQRLQQEGPADVLIVGSSRALRGVDPVALQKELANLGYKGVSVFNFGINGATAQVVELTLRRILQPGQLPKVIIWADGARAFNSGREDVTYNAIAASEGYRELLSGQLAVEGTAPEDASAATATNSGIAKSLASSYQSMDTWLSDQLASFSAVYPDREQLKTWFQQQMTVLASPVTTAAGQAEPMDAVMPEGSFIDFDGFLALSLQFNPATYYQKHARVQGLYDGDYEAFRLDGQQDEAFRELLQFTQAEGVPLVFINTPLTDEYLDDYRKEAEDAFLQYMLRLSATETGFIFRDLGQAWTQRYDYFSDPSHLNRYGAYQVSQRIAQDPMIPWPKTQAPSAASSLQSEVN